MTDLIKQNNENEVNVENIKLLNIQSDQMLSFSQRLKEVIGRNSIRGFAKKCNLSEGVVRKYLKDETEPTLKNLLSISRSNNIDLNWLATGEESTSLINNSDTSIVVDTKNHVVVNDLNIEVAAGNGIVPLNSVEPVGKFILSNDWLRVNRLLNKKLAIFHVIGDSMEPTINDDDIALVSLVEDSWTSALSGVFILRVDDALFIKRIQVDMIEKGIHIISDNPIYQRNFIKIDEATESKITIIAKVERILTKASSRNG